MSVKLSIRSLSLQYIFIRFKIKTQDKKKREIKHSEDKREEKKMLKIECPRDWGDLVFAW